MTGPTHPTPGTAAAPGSTARPVQGDTVGALVESGAQALAAAGVAFGHGTTNAHDEAAWLVLWRLGLPLDSDLSDSPDSVQKKPVAPETAALVATLFEERIRTRKPAAYLTREAWLQGVSFYVDERAIVPRSFIAEILVDGMADDFLSDQTRRLLDLCTGNGSLAVLAAMAWPEVEVTGADISPDALAVARINVDRHGLADRIALCISDGLAAVPGPWDLILCNPPYVNQLFKAAPACMSDDAVIILEIGNERAHFEAAFPQLPVFWLDTSAGEDQVLLVTRQALAAQSRLTAQ